MPVIYSDEGRDPATVVKISPTLVDPSKGQIKTRVGDQLLYIVEISDLPLRQKERCKAGLDIIVAKLFSVWSLRDSYAALEERLVSEAVKIPARMGGEVVVSGWQGLYSDFDLFSIQVKSVLDHVVFYLRYLADLEIFSFKKKGSVIVKKLENNFPGNASTGAKKSARNIATLIRANEPWLNGTIDVRDDFNHYTKGKMHPNRFVVLAVTKPDELTTVVRPEIEGMPVKAFMDLTVNNILVFVECFIGLCLCPRVTSTAIGHNWSGEMNDTVFFFMPWYEVDRLVAEGTFNAAEILLNERS